MQDILNEAIIHKVLDTSWKPQEELLESHAKLL